MFFVGILGVSSLQANEKSGVFIGGNVGIAANADQVSIAVSSGGGSFSANSATIALNPSYGVKAGYQQYFGAYNGLRIYGSFDYSHLDHNEMMKYGANIDYLVNFSDSDSPWGIFLGGGYEWLDGEVKKFLNDRVLIDGIKVHTTGFFVNAGFSKIYNNHHRIEFGAKVPLYTYSSIDIPGVKVFIRTFAVAYIGYSYSF